MPPKRNKKKAAAMKILRSFTIDFEEGENNSGNRRNENHHSRRMIRSGKTKTKDKSNRP